MKTTADLEWLESASARDLLSMACGHLKLDASIVALAPADTNALSFGNTPHEELQTLFAPHFPAGTDVAADLADEVQLCRAFAEPRLILGEIETKIEGIVSKFPTVAAHIQVGANKGDVLDPFILAANFDLLSGRNMDRTIEMTIAHKILMKIEDLLGGMHELVIGSMRGNFRVPEPLQTLSGSKNVLHPATNPFPGADIGQVPLPQTPNKIRLFQCKNKTGSAKGGDGARLGQQLRLLAETYGAETFYAAIVGNTLVGHRSKGAVLKASPETAVLVGNAALAELTRSDSGAELLLRTYRRAFRTVSHKTGYDFESVSTGIVADFSKLTAGGDFIDSWLHQAMGGPRVDQDSRFAQ
ncbi:hypothetical protein DC347_15560 [Pseudarthrobacter sp. AG30]|nr:hypothetical protein DC347_15560 [Pseudarthrobacter sp. AG30]